MNILPKESLPTNKEEWKQKLTPEEYHIMFEHGTEQAFTGALYQEHSDGMYRCKACGQPLFTSQSKFESGSGWPSFFQPVDDNSVVLTNDDSFGMRRIEASCSNCGAHLGHVFPDGPAPTGKRYCINSASLNLDKNN